MLSTGCVWVSLAPPVTGGAPVDVAGDCSAAGCGWPMAVVPEPRSMIPAASAAPAFRLFMVVTPYWKIREWEMTVRGSFRAGRIPIVESGSAAFAAPIAPVRRAAADRRHRA